MGMERGTILFYSAAGNTLPRRKLDGMTPLPEPQEEIAPQPVVAWRPQPGPQTALVHCVRPEIFFGGARGGGKTDGVLGKWAIKEKQYGSRFNGLALRRSAVSFADAIERS